VILVGDIAMTQGGMLISKIKQANPNIQILTVAAHHSDEARVLEYGADEFAIKPIRSIRDEL
jgi:DNA-binding response OmpR family regulator